jgi:flagellar assembly protein FliH
MTSSPSNSNGKVIRGRSSANDLASADAAWQPRPLDGPAPQPSAPVTPSSKSPAGSAGLPPTLPAALPFLQPAAGVKNSPVVRGQAASGPIWVPGEIRPSRPSERVPRPSEATLTAGQGLAQPWAPETTPPPDFSELRASVIAQALAQAREQTDLETEQMIAAARSQADDIVQQARSSSAQVTRQAHRDGVAAANAEVTSLLAMARKIVDEVRAWQEMVLTQNEALIFELILDIAHKLFDDGLELPEEVLQRAFERALSEARSLGDLRIRARPEDIAALGGLWPTRQTAESGQKIEMIPAKDMERGGCYIEGQYGSVDGRVRTQMRLVTETLGEVFAAEGAAASDPFVPYTAVEAGGRP